MKNFKQPTTEIIARDYRGCGAYLAAFNVAGECVALQRLDDYRDRLSRVIGKPDARTKAAKQAFIFARAAAADADAAVRRDWADEVRRWRPEVATATLAVDMSCTEIVWRNSDLAWAAQDALEGTLHLDGGIADREYAAAARAMAARLPA